MKKAMKRSYVVGARIANGEWELPYLLLATRYSLLATRSSGGNFTMSELINVRSNRNDLRRQLLATVSALTLLGFMNGAQASEDAAPDHPLVWIELGSQLDREIDPAQTWLPPNIPAPLKQPAFEPFGRMPRIGYDLDGKISFQPDDSSWIFSAAIRYGKAKRGPKYTHDQDNISGTYFGQPALPTYAFTDLHSRADASHLIVDFQAGKDLGVGLFGGHASSSINFGIRVAQFTEDARGSMTAQVSVPHKYEAGIDNYGDLHAARSFSGIGPSIDWKASLPVAGSLENGLALDWGANGAFLFGRQKTDVRLHTKQIRYAFFYSSVPPVLLAQSTSEPVRRKQVIVPNIGGFAGLSYRMGGRGKIALGYRADFFFGAIDGGLATRKSENVGFYGPFASVSIGIGG